MNENTSPVSEKMKKDILELAEKHKENTDKFIRVIEKIIVPTEYQKKDLFLSVGNMLYLSSSSYIRMASASWEHALKYLENKDGIERAKILT